MRHAYTIKVHLSAEHVDYAWLPLDEACAHIAPYRNAMKEILRETYAYIVKIRQM